MAELFDCTFCFDDTIFGVRFCKVGSVVGTAVAPDDAVDVKIAPVVSDFGWEMQNCNKKCVKILTLKNKHQQKKP